MAQEIMWKMRNEILNGNAEFRIRKYDGEFFADYGWHSFPIAPEDVEMLLNVTMTLVLRRLNAEVRK